VVGGGYSGVETAATMSLLCREAARRYPGLAPYIDWRLIDIAPRLLPELSEELGDTAIRVLRRRGISVELGISVDEVTERTVTLTDGRVLPCRTLIWTAGVAPSPLMEATGLPTDRGRLQVDATLAVPDYPEIFAIGDGAAVPDLSTGGGVSCPPTAQAATRQGPIAADNIIDSLLGRPLQEYHHRDLGLVVDLSGRDAVAMPLGTELSGLLGLAVTRAYHLYALPSGPARARVAANWTIRYLLGGEVSRLGFTQHPVDSFADADARQQYLEPSRVREILAELGATADWHDAGTAPLPRPRHRSGSGR
jgi:NADH:ubiquinone reductase (H+-translocating)